MAVEARLADQDLGTPAEQLLQARDLPAQLVEVPVGGRGGRLADAGRRAVAAEDLAEGSRPLSRGGAGASSGDRRDHQVLLAVLAARRRGERRQRRVHLVLVARGAPAAQRLNLLGFAGGVDDQDAAL